MAKRSQEFEIKFVGAPRDIAALPQSALINALSPEGGEWERLESAYFDTKDAALAKRGFSLRLREEAGGLIQAVKAERPAGGGVARDEIETRLSRLADFPARIEVKSIDKAIADHRKALRPIARTYCERWSKTIDFRGALIEIAVDIGRFECARGKRNSPAIAPLAELELELKAGPPEALFELARLIARNAPLRLRVQSKLETALALKDARSFAIEKAPRIVAEPDAPTWMLLQSALLATAQRLARLQAPMLDARLAEGVHQMRVALRRFRAFERVFRRHIDDPALADLALRAKSFADAMAEARDLDVFLCETVPPIAAHEGAPAGFAQLRAKGETARIGAWMRAVETIGGAEFTVFLIDLIEAGLSAPWRSGADESLERALRKFAPQALERALKRTKKIARRIDLDNPQELHRLRIALKKLRYPIQIFRALYPKNTRRDYMAALSDLQASFGAVNDAIVAQGIAERLAAGEGGEAMRAAGFVAGFKAAEADASARTIRTAWPEFIKTKPFWRKD